MSRRHYVTVLSPNVVSTEMNMSTGQAVPAEKDTSSAPAPAPAPAAAQAQSLEWQIHYREQGQGIPLILLHPSPLSSRFMEPLLSLFAPQARVIAWDTPGYGQSDPLPCAAVQKKDMAGKKDAAQKQNGLAPYVQALSDFIEALGLDRPVIYGSATGAQIAIEFGKSHPEKTRGLLLENVAWFFDNERDEILKSYFPDIAPQPDGRHLQQVWQMVSQLYNYFPWFDTSESGRVKDAIVPVELLQKTALDYFIAGSDYALAYRAAFINEKPEQLQPLQLPVRIVRWQDSLLKKYSDRLDDAGLPGNIEMRYADAGIDARFLTLAQALRELIPN